MSVRNVTINKFTLPLSLFNKFYCFKIYTILDTTSNTKLQIKLHYNVIRYV